MTRDAAHRTGRAISMLATAMIVGFAAPMPLWAAQAFQESAGQVVMEAENYDTKIARNGKDWVLETRLASFSGTGHMTALPNGTVVQKTGYTTNSPELVYNVQFTTTGTYYLWVRGAGGGDDTYHAGIDNTAPVSAANLGEFGATWGWNSTFWDSTGRPTLTVSSASVHTIHIWMRHDGFPIDKILLRTNSSTTAPSGAGPAESPRVTVGVDATPPTGSVTINGGAAQTNTATVTLTVSATDDSGSVAQMQFSNDGATYSTPESYAGTKAWTLASGDGTKTVYAKFKDTAGNWSVAATDTITLDTTAPTISGVSASGVTASAATIAWTTNEPASSQVEYGLTTGYGQTTALDAALVRSHSVPLSGLTANTTHHYRVRSKDAAGNEKVGSDATFKTTVAPDTTPPTVSLTSPIAGATVSGTITVSATASDDVGVAGVQFLLDGANLGAEDTASPYSVSWDTTTATNASHTLTAVARDAAGNRTTSGSVAVTVNNVPLDVTPPAGTVTINGGAVATNTPNATLTLAATDDSGTVAQMQFSNDGVTYSTAEAYATSKSWTLASGDGTKTVYAKFRDAAGNWSAAATDTITLDTTPPAVSFTSPTDGAVITAP